MPAISNTTPASLNTDNQNTNHTLRGWLPVIMTMPLLVTVLLFLLCTPTLYWMVRYGRIAGTEGSSSSRGPASTEFASTDDRDLPRLDSIAPPKTSKDMRRELTDVVHVSWAMLSSDMTWTLTWFVTWRVSILSTQIVLLRGTLRNMIHAPYAHVIFASPKPVLQRPSQAHVSDHGADVAGLVLDLDPDNLDLTTIQTAR
ncbi:hypothetical protein QL093DRAFT_2084516 [Fusarium oxysporum]|nr:hypothetical protein QL093DRAFT_2084516 [Fusarium oxysporum]